MKYYDGLKKWNEDGLVAEIETQLLEKYIEDLIEELEKRGVKLNLPDSSSQLKEKEETVIEGIDTIYLDKNGNEMVLLSNITMTIEQYRKYTETIAKS